MFESMPACLCRLRCSSILGYLLYPPNDMGSCTLIGELHPQPHGQQLMVYVLMQFLILNHITVELRISDFQFLQKTLLFQMVTTVPYVVALSVGLSVTSPRQMSHETASW